MYVKIMLSLGPVVAMVVVVAVVGVAPGRRQKQHQH